MNYEKSLSITVLLSDLYEKKKDNLEMIKPFIMFLLSKYPSELDLEQVKSKLESDFCFPNFPHIILRELINSLIKDGKIIKRDKKYIINDLSIKEINRFEDKLNNARQECKTVIDELSIYLKNNTNLKVSTFDIKNALVLFLDKNPSILYSDFNPLNLKNSNSLQFHIGKFVTDEYKKKSKIFTILQNMEEGIFISNVIYLQISVNSKTSLNNLSCYLDSPFLLKLLGFKKNEENIEAIELVQMLKKKGAKIKCFYHTFEEVQTILRNYINKDSNSTKTLEGLDALNLDQLTLGELYSNLQEKFFEHNVEITDIPPYQKDIYRKNAYEDNLDEKELKNVLAERYINNDTKEKTIDNDVKSVSAIYRLRNGKKITRFDNCNSIFITCNRELRNATRKLLNIDERLEISPVICDFDLTAIIWLMDLSDASDLPKDKLINNARAAMEPSDEVVRSFINNISKVKIKGVDKNSDLQYLIRSTYFSAKLMDKIDGDPQKIKPSIISNLYQDEFKENRLLREEKSIFESKNKTLSEEKENLIREKVILENKCANMENNIQNKYRKKYYTLYNILLITSISFVVISLLSCFIFSIIYVIKDGIDDSSSTFWKTIGILISILGLSGEYFGLPNYFSLIKFIKKQFNTIVLPKFENKADQLAEREINKMYADFKDIN